MVWRYYPPKLLLQQWQNSDPRRWPRHGSTHFRSLAEFFLQHLEKTHIPRLSDKHKITRYFRYVDDILIIYDSNLSDLHNILDDFNKIHPKLNFTAQQETDSQLNFLDITIHRTPTDWKFAIYRKPTFTDTIIPHDSNHPNQLKYATLKYLYNRLNTFDLHGDYYKTETTTIQNILHNNGFPFHPPTPRPAPNNNRKQPSNTHTQTPNPKWPFSHISNLRLYKKCDYYSLHSLGEIITLFIKQFNLNLLGTWENSSNVVLVKFVALPRSVT